MCTCALIWNPNKRETPIHSIYWKKHEKYRGIYTMATISKGNPNTKIKATPYKGSDKVQPKGEKRYHKDLPSSSEIKQIIVFV
jgi:hypothetical protein